MGCASSSADTADRPLADIGGRGGSGTKQRSRGKTGTAKRSGGRNRRPDRRTSSMSASQLAGGMPNPLQAAPPPRMEEVVKEEEHARADAQLAQDRQWQMLLYDFKNCAPSADDADIVAIPGYSVQVGFETPDEDEDDRPRRSTMNQREYDAAKRMRGAQSSAPSPTTSVPSTASPLSRAMIRTHTSEDDCWVIVRGEVFDVTPLLDTHPGGLYAIFQHGGTDATSIFDAAHPVRPTEQLQAFRIGRVDEGP